jgi:HSP20 family protein
MNLQTLAPWNWFKHEEAPSENTIPVKRNLASNQSHFPQANHPVMQLQQEIDRLFDQTFKSLPWFASSLSDSALTRGGMFQNLGFRPQLNIASDDQQYHISLEVPGLKEEDLVLELNANNTLSIRGEKNQEVETKDKRYYHIERSYGQFERLLALPSDSDTEQLRATLKNGVLEIFLPKKPLSALGSSGKKIPINDIH